MIVRALDGIKPFQGAKQVTEQQLADAVTEAYALDQGRYEETLELAMKEEVYRQLKSQLRHLRTSSGKYIFGAFTPRPMTSLRDVDKPVFFGPDPQTVRWQELRWVNRQTSDGNANQE
jgi:hypothetical protein